MIRRSGADYCLSTVNQIRLFREYDAAKWQVLPALPHPAVSFLFTWTVVPAPIDAGVPEPVATMLANALSSIGIVYFGADPGAENEVAQVAVRRQLRSESISVVASRSVDAILPAFSSARHDWSQNAQWLVVSEEGRAQPRTDWLAPLIRELYRDWSLSAIPPKVSLVVQAAVDGDGAACHCKDASTAERLIECLRAGAEAAGFAFAEDVAG